MRTRSLTLPLLATMFALAVPRCAVAESVQLKEDGGTLLVPVLINDRISLDFTLDSGASDVSIPADVFLTLRRAGTVATEDLLDQQTYKLADGSEQTRRRFRIRSLRIGTLELRDVSASVAPVAGPLLLGQSFLSRIEFWKIDNVAHVLVLNDRSIPRITSTDPARAPTEKGVLTLDEILAEPVPVRRSLNDADVADGGAFLKALAFLLYGKEAREVLFSDRRNCVVTRKDVASKDGHWKELLYLNNVDRERSTIRVAARSGRPSEQIVEIVLRGESVFEETSLPSDKHSISEYVIVLGTDEIDRVGRAWDYVYSHGCTTRKSSF